jgi:hypothetical protein
MSKQIKLKSLLKEGYAWERKPGKPLPTIQEVMDEFEAKQQKESIPPVHVQEVEDMSSKFWVVAKDKRGALYVFNDGYYNTKEEAEEALKNITVPKIVDANTIKVEPVPTSPNYTVLYDNLSEGSLEEKLNESIKHFKNPVNVAKLSLKDTLDLQRTAKIITESQYKKLLNEENSWADVDKEIEDKETQDLEAANLFLNTPQGKNAVRALKSLISKPYGYAKLDKVLQILNLSLENFKYAAKAAGMKFGGNDTGIRIDDANYLDPDVSITNQNGKWMVG